MMTADFLNRHGWRAAAWLALATAIGAPLSAQPARSTKDGVFSAAQAARGQAIYVDKCGPCHGDDLAGGGFAPALAGESFLASWAGQSLDDLFGRIKDTMPADNPGSLTDEQNADIVAQILKANGFTAGEQPLAAGAGLKQVAIAKP